MKKIMGYTEVRFPDVEIEDEIIPDVVITVKDMIVENGVITEYQIEDITSEGQKLDSTYYRIAFEYYRIAFDERVNERIREDINERYASGEFY